MNKNYQTFLAKIDKESSIRYLKEEYPQIIQSFQDIPNLSLENMFKIVIAAEKDCYRLTAEIDQLKGKLRKQQQQRVSLENSEMSEISLRPQYIEADEEKEILYDQESQLQSLVLLLKDRHLIDLKVTSQVELNMQTSIELLSQFIHGRCLDQDANAIMQQQLRDEVQQQRIKNFELQVDNMKIFSNMDTKKRMSGDVFVNKQRLQRNLCRILRTIRQLRKEQADIRSTVQGQYVLFRDKDDLVDKVEIQDFFLGIYHKLLKRIQHLNLKPFHKEVKLVLRQSNELKYLPSINRISSHRISDTVSKLKFRHQERIQKLTSVLSLGKELIVQRQLEKLLTLLSEVWKGLTKLNSLNCNLHEVFSDKAGLEHDVRNAMGNMIQKVCNQNLQLKMVVLQKALEKPLVRQSIDSWNNLKSI